MYFPRSRVRAIRDCFLAVAAVILCTLPALRAQSADSLIAILHQVESAKEKHTTAGVRSMTAWRTFFEQVVSTVAPTNDPAALVLLAQADSEKVFDPLMTVGGESAAAIVDGLRRSLPNAYSGSSGLVWSDCWSSCPSFRATSEALLSVWSLRSRASGWRRATTHWNSQPCCACPTRLTMMTSFDRLRR